MPADSKAPEDQRPAPHEQVTRRYHDAAGRVVRVEEVIDPAKGPDDPKGVRTTLLEYDPSGNLVASSANGTSVSEAVSIPRPVAGTWRVLLKGYLNTPTSYTGSAEVDQLVPVSQ